MVQQQYTIQDVASHSKPTDAWLIIENNVYDISNWKHPGGDIIMSYAGRDATDVFNALHKGKTVRSSLRALHIGKLLNNNTIEDTNQSMLLADFRKMRAKMEADGIMHSNPVYYMRKVIEIVGMMAFSGYLLLSGATVANSAMWWAACLIRALFIAQCGWLGHDFLHQQVMRSNKWNNFIGATILGLGMGGSAHWWKNKHNRHHATPNRLDGDNVLDPDIDTIPLIAWDEKLAKMVPVSRRGIIEIQHILLWPLLFVAYFNWLHQSTVHMLTFPTITLSQRVLEMILCGTHHIAMISTIALSGLSFLSGVGFWIMANAVAGFILAFVFVQSHNAKEVYIDDKDFVTAQIVSTRNINPGFITDWFFGGLNYQIEHHLLPTLPRHNLCAARSYVMKLCAKHNLVYESCSLLESNYKVYKRLLSVSRYTS